MTRDHSTDDGRGTDGSETSRTRRAFLGATAGCGLLATAPGPIAGQATDGDATPSESRTDEVRPQPETPRNLTASIPSGSSGTELSWDGPEDPCSAPVDRYVITADGERIESVPAGITRAVLLPRSGTTTYGVYAATDDGVRSPAATVGAATGVADPPYSLSIVPERDAVAPDESVRAAVRVDPVLDSVPAFEEFEVSLELSTPCAAEIADATAGDGVDTTSALDLAADGAAVTISGSGIADRGDRGRVTLAHVEIVGRERGGTELHGSVTLAGTDSGSSITLSDWATLAVGEAAVKPPAPTNVDWGAAPADGDHFAVFWDGVADPCESSVTSYVVTVAGEERATVPAGRTAALVPFPDDASVDVPFGVYAVDAEGRESPVVGGEAQNVIADYGTHIRLRPEADATAVGEETPVTVELVGGAIGRRPDGVDDFEVTVSVSSPCVARITDAFYAPEVTDMEAPDVAVDGREVTLSAGGATTEDDGDALALGFFRVEGVSPGGVDFDFEEVSITVDGSSPAVGEVWTSLAVEEEAPVGGPPAPTDLEAGYAFGRSELTAVSWSGPGAPCDSPVDHYVVSLEGTDVATVPAGRTVAAIDPENTEETVTYGVRAVDADGNASETVTGEHQPVWADVPYLLRVFPERDSIAAGESTRAAVEVVEGPVGTGLEVVEEFQVTVETSAACVARLTDAAPAEGVQETEGTAVADDGASATLTGAGAARGEDSSVRLGTVEVTGREQGGVALDVTVDAATIDGSEASPAPVWVPVEVAGTDPSVGPQTPADLTVDRGGSTTSLLSWDGALNPCNTAIDRYVVSADGEDVETLPAGVTKAAVDAGGGEHRFGVRAVDASGNASRTIERTDAVPTNDPTAFLEVDAADDAVAPGETVTADLRVEPGYVAPDPTIDGEVRVDVEVVCSLGVTDVSFGDGAPAGASAEVAEDGSTATLSAGDGTFTGTFATLELTGRAPGASLVDVSAPDDGGVVERWTAVSVGQTDDDRPPVVGDADARPTDPDSDGLYEDVSGNGHQDIADAVELFQHREEVDPQYFDFTGDGSMSIGDAVSLFQENTG